MVLPFARALELLEAWTPRDRWLGNLELSLRTGLPRSTVNRLVHALVEVGYLHYSPSERKYRLAAAVLALGYGAIANSAVQRAARAHMQAYAEQHKLQVTLSAREGLDLMVLESCSTPQAPVTLNLTVGFRVSIASSPLGWALLAALPDLERFYLLEHVQRRLAREWSRLRRRLMEGIAQVQQAGWCASLGERDQDLGILAAPLVVAGHGPLVLACIGASARMTRARVERELAPRLLAMATAIQQQLQPDTP